MLNFVLFCLTCNDIMHILILPLPLCELYSIRAQNGYGQHRPCKIVLLTLVAPRGVHDRYRSWGMNIEHARTAYHKTCGTEYQQSHIVDLINKNIILLPYYKWNIAQAHPMSVSDVSRSLQSRVSSTHRSYSQLTFFNFFIKYCCSTWTPEFRFFPLRNRKDVCTSMLKKYAPNTPLHMCKIPVCYLEHTYYTLISPVLAAAVMVSVFALFLFPWGILPLQS